MRFNIFWISCFVLLSCDKDRTTFLNAEAVSYDISSEKREDRFLKVIHSTPKDSMVYYAEFLDTVKGKANKGWEFRMLDDRSGLMQSTLRVYRIRRIKEIPEVFATGNYYTLRNLFLKDSFEVIVQLSTITNGASVAYRANQKKPGNFIRIEDYSSTHLLLTFNLEASPDAGTQYLSWFTGRFLIKKD